MRFAKTNYRLDWLYAAFVCAMEQVLGVYTRPQDPAYPFTCMDETTKQCVKETRVPQPVASGRPARFDAEYERNGVANLLLYPRAAGELAAGGREVRPCRSHLGGRRAPAGGRGFPEAERVTLVMDNLNTHAGASLYKAFPAPQARQLLEKLQFVYTPKHGSWLNMAECEFSVLARQCLNRRVSDNDTVREERAAWTKRRNACTTPAQWRFTTEDARIKLHTSQLVSGIIKLKEH